MVNGIGIASGWQQLGTPTPTNCTWFATFPNYNSYGAPPLYADAGLTTPLWSDINGNGYLRTLMNGMGGNAYLPFTDTGGFNSGSLFLYYYGSSDMPIDVYDGFGNLVYTINFQKVAPAYASSCEPVYCYEGTFDKTYDKVLKIEFFEPTFTSTDLMQSPPSYALIDVTDNTNMEKLVTWIYGADAGYVLIDNGTTYTMRFVNCYYWGTAPSIVVIDSSFNLLPVLLSPTSC